MVISPNNSKSCKAEHDQNRFERLGLRRAVRCRQQGCGKRGQPITDYQHLRILQSGCEDIFTTVMLITLSAFKKIRMQCNGKGCNGPA